MDTPNGTVQLKHRLEPRKCMHNDTDVKSIKSWHEVPSINLQIHDSLDTMKGWQCLCSVQEIPKYMTDRSFLWFLSICNRWCICE